VITDLAMPGVDGMGVLDRVKEHSPETLVLMVTAYATAESAVEAMKRGAYDYLMKPFKVDEIRLVIRNALEKTALRRENRTLRDQVERRKEFVGVSEKIKRVFDLIDRIASGRSSVFIVGESGTGKELVARAIHEKSARSDKPFVSINCAAIPENLIESELFGYMKGAFTGAATNKMGLFEAAHEGTLFLDEVGELPSSVQVKLLRVLQERALRRVGSTTSTPIDVRILSATNRNLEDDVKSGRFREDLFYRLNVIQIHVPPLRDRPEDIPVLATYFLERYAAEHGKKLEGISREAMDKIRSYSFPGNVRELENMIEQSVALETSKTIRPESLPEKMKEDRGVPAPPTDHFPPAGVDLQTVIDAYERNLILEALRASGGIQKKAAELLKISFRSIRYRMVKHGIHAPEDVTE
jgi:two-component system response regulator PilR (NtrC family)